MKLLIWFLFFYLIYKLIKNLFFVVKAPQDGNGQSYSPHSRRPGETTIISKPDNAANQPVSNNTDGEYIPYREVK